MFERQVRSIFMRYFRVLGMVLVNSVLDLVTVVLYQALHWPGCSIAQRTNRVPFNLLCQLPQHIDLSIVSLTDLKSTHSISQPTRTLSARSALTTTLVLVKLTQTQDRLNHIS